MNITNVKVHRLDGDKVLALVSITIDNEFVVSGLKVLDGQNGIFVAMPNRKDSKNEYHDIAFPITKGARENIQRLVLDKFNSIEGERFTPPNLDNDSKHRQGYEKAPTIDVDEEILPF